MWLLLFPDYHRIRSRRHPIPSPTNQGRQSTSSEYIRGFLGRILDRHSSGQFVVLILCCSFIEYCKSYFNTLRRKKVLVCVATSSILLERRGRRVLPSKSDRQFYYYSPFAHDFGKCSKNKQFLTIMFSPPAILANNRTCRNPYGELVLFTSPPATPRTTPHTHPTIEASGTLSVRNVQIIGFIFTQFHTFAYYSGYTGAFPGSAEVNHLSETYSGVCVRIKTISGGASILPQELRRASWNNRMRV